MTAYVHIGTEKTGTTSIQAFLSSNRELLERQNMAYPSTIGQNCSQWNFTFLAYNSIRNDEYCIGRKIYTKHNFKNHKKKSFFNLKEELKNSNCQKLLISSEHLSSRLQDPKEIKRCKKILHLLGFKKIKVTVYLREQSNEVISAFSTAIKSGGAPNNIQSNPDRYIRGRYDLLLSRWLDIFGKENLIVRLFDKNEFKDGDLLKDFVDAIGLEWDDNFIIPENQNETLDLMGIELLKRINKHLPWKINNQRNHLRGDITSFAGKYFQNSKDPYFKFQAQKEIIQSYIDYFEESNEWVRKEFFPHKERLFPKKDLSNYKENYELKEMKPEYWDRIAEFIADIVKTKNQTIADKTTIIQNKDKLITQKDQQLQQKDQIIQAKNQELESKTKELTSKTQELSSLPIKKQTLEIKNLEQDNLLKQIQIQEAKQDLINKQLHTKQLEKELGYESNVLKELELKNQQLTQTKNQLDFTKKELESKNKILSSNPNPSHPIQNTPNFKGKLAYLNTLTTAKDRIHNHLSYKLGQAMIENSKSLLGYIRMPYVLSYIKDKHKQEQQQYQEAIKKNPNLKLPTLESYPDYKESLKEKECLTYKLGEAFIKASKTWYKGGYVKLWFEVRELKKEFEK